MPPSEASVNGGVYSASKRCSMLAYVSMHRYKFGEVWRQKKKNPQPMRPRAAAFLAEKKWTRLNASKCV